MILLRDKYSFVYFCCKQIVSQIGSYRQNMKYILMNILKSYIWVITDKKYNYSK